MRRIWELVMTAKQMYPSDPFFDRFGGIVS